MEGVVLGATSAHIPLAAPFFRVYEIRTCEKVFNTHVVT